MKSAKYLGLTITSDLNWNNHINNITARANESLGFVKRNVKTRLRLIKTKVYKALVRPRLEYCSTVWDPQSKCATQRLEKRRAARFVLRRYHNTSSVSDMLDHLQWPTLAQRRCCYRLTLLYKITHNLVAVPSSQYRDLTHCHIYPSVVKLMLFKIVSFRKQSASGMRCQTIYSPCTIPPHLQDSNLPWELQSPILLIINCPSSIFAQSCWEEKHFISYPLHSLFYCFLLLLF